MDQLTQAQTALKVEREATERAALAKDKEIAELRTKLLKAQTQTALASGGAGVPDHLVKDYEWRRRAGLNHDQARDKSLEQWEQDQANQAALDAAEEAKNPKVATADAPAPAHAGAAHGTTKELSIPIGLAALPGDKKVGKDK